MQLLSEPINMVMHFPFPNPPRDLPFTPSNGKLFLLYCSPYLYTYMYRITMSCNVGIVFGRFITRPPLLPLELGLPIHYTVVWEIFACNNFRMLKFHMGKFSYNNGCSKFERAKRDFRFKIFLPFGSGRPSLGLK